MATDLEGSVWLKLKAPGYKTVLIAAYEQWCSAEWLEWVTTGEAVSKGSYVTVSQQL